MPKRLYVSRVNGCWQFFLQGLQSNCRWSDGKIAVRGFERMDVYFILIIVEVSFLKGELNKLFIHVVKIWMSLLNCDYN